MQMNNHSCCNVERNVLYSSRNFKFISSLPSDRNSNSLYDNQEMSNCKKNKLPLLNEQSVEPFEGQGMFENIPVLKQIAPSSTGQRMTGKVAIITGVNSPLGIGRASAHQFAQNGAKAIFICDIIDSYLEVHKREIASLYPLVEIHTRKFDASDENAVKAVVDDAIKLYDRLDIFFANAGSVGHLKHFASISSEEFLNTLKINVLRFR
ncbi:Levodione reductase [Golovinomyces cichoracearum]|uniref:Levodione reductase n=1 Tax=Golovinomyces cichoracearum TaxID=62708 RepID=A0A420GIS1_9PEZI|nr:Levodione reductase [Golovinomyces cichoracearum]